MYTTQIPNGPSIYFEKNGAPPTHVVLAQDAPTGKWEPYTCTSKRAYARRCVRALRKQSVHALSLSHIDECPRPKKGLVKYGAHYRVYVLIVED